MSQPICIKVRRFVGDREGCCCLDCTIDLNTSTFPNAIDLIPFVNELIIENCTALHGSVAISGTLLHELLVKMQGGSGAACALVTCGSNTAAVSCGPVQHLTLPIDFTCDLNIPDARLGDSCEIKRAEVVSQDLKLMVNPFTGFVVSAEEKTCIRAEISLVRPVKLIVAAEAAFPAACPPSLLPCPM